MYRRKNELPKYCSWNVDRHGKRRVRFRKNGFSTYLTGAPWSEQFMRQYTTALDGMKAQTSNIGADRTVAGTVNALVATYLDCSPISTSKIEALTKKIVRAAAKGLILNSPTKSKDCRPMEKNRPIWLRIPCQSDMRHWRKQITPRRTQGPRYAFPDSACIDGIE